MPEFLRYRDDLETLLPDEAETIEKIKEVMLKGMANVRPKAGENVRVSHAKAHGFMKGELIVHDDLPPELAQGLFAKAGTYPVLLRIAQAPGENLDDRTVSTSRGVGIKIFNVAGDKLPGHEGNTTQDFVLENGRTFLTANSKTFLQAFKPNALVAPKLPEAVKGAVSKASNATNAVLNMFGLDSVKLDFYGHPKYHPLAEAFYSQAPLRYGDFVAKISVTPANPELEAQFPKTFTMNDENGLRTMTVNYFREHGAEFAVNVQLAVDEQTTPIEDASVEWPEDVTPYRRVATIRLPKQNAYAPARQDYVDHHLSFAPGHALIAHRPLGSIMRARLAVYPLLANKRRDENGQEKIEPTALGQIPD